MQRPGVMSCSYQININPSEGDGIRSVFTCNTCVLRFDLASFSWTILMLISSGPRGRRPALQVGV